MLKEKQEIIYRSVNFLLLRSKTIIRLKFKFNFRIQFEYNENLNSIDIRGIK